MAKEGVAGASEKSRLSTVDVGGGPRRPWWRVVSKAGCVQGGSWVENGAAGDHPPELGTSNRRATIREAHQQSPALSPPTPSFEASRGLTGASLTRGLRGRCWTGTGGGGERPRAAEVNGRGWPDPAGAGGQHLPRETAGQHMETVVLGAGSRRLTPDSRVGSASGGEKAREEGAVPDGEEARAGGDRKSVV